MRRFIVALISLSRSDNLAIYLNFAMWYNLVKGGVFMANSIMLDRAKTLAISIVKICRSIKETKKESVLTNQLLRAGTSIGANIHESKYAQSSADFVSKMQIALKECDETEYWLELLFETGYMTDTEYKPIQNECGAIRRMLISSINTTKSNLE